jgi:hypothetical protein
MPEADTRPAAVRTVADRRDGTRMSIVDVRNDTRSYANALAPLSEMMIRRTDIVPLACVDLVLLRRCAAVLDHSAAFSLCFSYCWRRVMF